MPVLGRKPRHQRKTAGGGKSWKLWLYLPWKLLREERWLMTDWSMQLLQSQPLQCLLLAGDQQPSTKTPWVWGRQPKILNAIQGVQVDSKRQLSACLGFSVATALWNVSQCQGLDKSKDPAPGTSQRPSGKGKEERQFQQQPSLPPTPTPFLTPTSSVPWPIPSPAQRPIRKLGPWPLLELRKGARKRCLGKIKRVSKKNF